MAFYLNKDIINLIFQFDPTFHIILKNDIIPYLQKMWGVKWTCKKTKTSGVDLTGFSGLINTSNNINIDNYTYNYDKCKKICKQRNLTYSGFYHKPVIL
jgi:hypothetical protein